MDWKVVSAFATGAVLASGIVYFAVKPEDVATKPAVPAKPIVPKAISSPPPTPQIAVAAHVPRTPVREKPSPMPPPVRRERPVTVAGYEPPPAPTSVALAPAPVLVKNVSLPAPTPAPAPKVEVRVPHVVTLAAGMSLAVRIGETVSSARNQPGDSFSATLTQPLVIDGLIIAERDARVVGKVVDASPAGRGRGVSHLAVSVVELATSDGQNIRIRTEPYTKDGPSPAAMDAAKVGGGAAVGAVIGAIAGGGRGAAIGAGAGGVLGAGDVLVTRAQPVEIPVETRINFRVQDSVTITERLD